MRRILKNGMIYLMSATLLVSGMPISVSAAEVDTTVEAVSAVVEDGIYTVPVALYKATGNTESMGNDALEPTGILSVEDGNATLRIGLKALQFSGLTGYLSELNTMSQIEYNNNNYPVSYEKVAANVLSVYDVVDAFNSPDSQDENCAGKAYPQEVEIAVAAGEEFTWVHMYIPLMGSLSSGNQEARLYIDYSQITPVVDSDKTQLSREIQDAEALSAADYTAASYQELIDAVAAAQEVQNDLQASQEQVDAAAAAVAAAVKQLEWNLPDGKYDITAQIWKTASDEISMSNGVIKSAQIIVRDNIAQVVIYAQPLSVSMGGQTITSSMIGLRYMDQGEYQDADILQLDEEENPLIFSFTLPKNSSLTEIQMNSGRWQEARLYLDYSSIQLTIVDSDKTQLTQEIENAKVLPEGRYTRDSYQKLLAAVAAAETVLNDVQASQEEVDAKAAAVAEAVSQLEWSLLDGKYDITAQIWKTTGDEISMSNGVIKSAQVIVQDNSARIVIYAQPLTVNMGGQTITSSMVGLRYMDQGEYQDADILERDAEQNPLIFSFTLPKNTDLTNIQMNSGRWQEARLYLDYSSIQMSYDKTSLNEKLAEAKAVSSGKYTAASFRVLQEAIAEAQTVLDSVDVTQEQIDQNVKTLLAAIAGLELNPTISLDKTAATIYPKGTSSVTLTAAVTGPAANVVWSSGNSKVATVKNGKVTAVKAGTTTIKATANGVSATCKITVKNNTLTISKTKATIYTKGAKTVTLKASMTGGAAAKVSWSSSNKKIATVKNGKVTAVKAGTVTIKATANGITKTCKITVKKPSLKLKKSSASIARKKSVTIKATAAPKGTIKYKSSNKKIATVTKKGVVKGIKKGTAKITVTCNGVSKTFKVTVK